MNQEEKERLKRAIETLKELAEKAKIEAGNVSPLLSNLRDYFEGNMVAYEVAANYLEDLFFENE